MSEQKSEQGGIIRFLRSAFVEDVPERAEQPMVSQSAAPQVVPAAAPDPAALAKLESLLQASLPPIYATWMEKFAQLADVIPDAAMRFKAALKTSGATPAQLSAALDQLLKTVDGAHVDFMEMFSAKTARVEGSAREAISSTEALIASRESQLKAIQDEIASLRSKLATETAHRLDEQQRLDGVRYGFEAALSQVQGRLVEQKNQIDLLARG